MPAFLIVDDHVVVRRGLRQILAEEFGGAVFGEAQRAKEALERMRDQKWDLVLLDIAMPDGSGFEVLEAIRRHATPPPVLVLSVHPEQHYAVRALTRGAAGYLTKDCPREELIMGVRRVLEGGKFVSSSMTEKLLPPWTAHPGQPPHTLLSDREYQVVRALASGRRLKAIAQELSVSIKTISTYRHRALEKMGLRTNADLTRYVIEHELLP